MRPSHGGGMNEDPTYLEMLMALLADVNDRMIVIATELRQKPPVMKATRGCDVRKYRDDFRFDGAGCYNFETYVEALMPDDSVFCWYVDIRRTPSGWEIARTISHDRSFADGVTTTFPDLSSPAFLEFVGQVNDAMAEFVETARTYKLA